MIKCIHQLLWKLRHPTLEHNITELREKYPQHNIGVGTYGDPAIRGNGKLTIGAYTCIAPEVAILTGESEHRPDWIAQYPFLALRRDWRVPYPATNPHNSDGHTRIGSDVWIGFRAIVLAGRTIGHGAVVGAGAVVASDVPPYAVVVGVPAMVHKYRFAPDKIAQLLKYKWWDIPIDEVNAIRLSRPCETCLDGLFNPLRNYANCWECRNQCNYRRSDE